MIFARALFVLMLLLLAKGWTISSEKLTHKYIVGGSVGVFFLFSLITLGVQYGSEDSKSDTLSSGTQAMIVLTTLIWLALGVWFTIQCLYFSYRLEQNEVKRSVYLRVGLVFSLYFLIPTLLNLGSLAMDPWARDVAQITTTTWISMLAMASLSFLLWPSRATSFFDVATPDVSAGVNTDYDAL